MAESSSLINLRSVLDFSSKMNDSLEDNFIISSTMLSLMGKLKIPKISAFVKDQDKFKHIFNKGLDFPFSDISFENAEYFFRISPTDEQYQELFDNGLRYIIPLQHRDSTLALIAIGDNLFKTHYSDEEIEYAKIICSIAANSLQIALSYQTLQQEQKMTLLKNQVLNTLMEISNDFSSFSDLNKILQGFSLNLMGQLMVSKFAIFRYENSNFVEIVNRIGKEVPNILLEKTKSLGKISFFNNLPKEIAAQFHHFTGYTLAPMISNNQIKGIIFIGKRLDSKDFSEENFQFIEIITNTLTVALENHRLFLEAIEKKKIDIDLNLALEIQRKLLPKNNPAIEGYDIYGTSIPSKKVSGDYYDYIKINKDETLIIIADISGKGIPAALLMANLQAAIRSIANLGLTLNTMLHNINSLLYENSAPEKFATLFIAKLNAKKNSFEYINAGHNPPLLINNGSVVKELIEGGIILGIIPDIPDFESETIQLSHGDRILLYTDGVTEAMNDKDEEFGLEKLEEIVKLDFGSSEKTVENILSAIKKFTQNQIQFDDITLITITKN